MKFQGGDSIKFGKRWCKGHNSKHLVNKTIMLTPQYFEEDNGLYCYETECLGIWDEKNEEADSIYHLFGNHLEEFMDCELIKGSQEDIAKYEKIKQDRLDEQSKYWEQMVSSIEEVI